MENDKIVLVANRAVGTLSYDLPELRISRHFEPKEVKEIPFGELHALYQTSGGRVLIEDCLSIKDKDALQALNVNVEPEYFYSEDEVKKIMVNGTMDEFLDMLDFAPVGVLDIVKNLAVSLPLNDVEKREAILEKLSFNVTKAIEIKNTNFDDGSKDSTNENNTNQRRVRVTSDEVEEKSSTTTVRRVVKKG